MDYVELDDEHAIIEVSVPENWVGKTVAQLDIRRKYNVNILAVKKGGEMMLTITPDTLMDAADTLLVLGDYQTMQKCFSSTRHII